MKKLLSTATVVAFVLSSIIMSGCATVSSGLAGTEAGKQSNEEMLPLIKLPVKKVSIFSCALLKVMYDPKYPVQMSEKYSTANKKDVEDFFKTSTALFKDAGYEVEIKNLPTSACYDLESFIGESGAETFSIMTLFFAHENGPGYQTLKVQSSIIPNGQKGRFFAHETSINGVMLSPFGSGPVKGAKEVMEPIINLLKAAKQAR